MVGDVDTVVLQFVADILVQELEIDALLQGLLTGCIQYIIYDLVEQGFLIDIAIAHNLLKRFRSFRQLVLVCTHHHGLGHIGWLGGEGLQLKL